MGVVVVVVEVVEVVLVSRIETFVVDDEVCVSAAMVVKGARLVDDDEDATPLMWER